MYVASAGLDAVFVIGEMSLPINGIKGSGNNINIQVQENSGNDIGGQSGLGEIILTHPYTTDSQQIRIVV